MEEPRNRYILLKDCIEETLKRSVPRQADHFCDLTWSLFSSPRQVPKGELLEALPESEQPGVSTRIALGGIDRKLRLECRMEDVKKLTPEEADLLLGISSTKSRFEIYFDGKRLDFGKRLEHGSHVLVSIQHVSQKLSGVVRFKGGLPNLPGTMFGVELHVQQNPGFGTCDGTYGNKRYFNCAPDSGVFVGFDKLAPLEDNSELTTSSDSPKRDDHCEVNMTELDLVFPSLGKGKSDSELPQDKMCGHETGRWKGHQPFVCKRDLACFVDVETIMLEEDSDMDAKRAKKKATSQKQDKQLRDSKDRASKETVRQSNSSNSAAIVAAGESSKTDPREFIERQQQLLDYFQNCPTFDENVAMNDDGRTDSTGVT